MRKTSTVPEPSAHSPRPLSGLAIFVLCLRVGVAALVVPLISPLLWWMRLHSAIHFMGWINVEYLLLLSLAFLFPSWIMIALLTVELTIDLVQPITHLYYFSLSDTIHSLRYLAFLSPRRLVTDACLLVLYMAGSALVLRVLIGARRRPQAKQIASLLLVCIFLAVAVDLVRERGRILEQFQPLGVDLDLRNTHMTRMPALTLLGTYFFGHADPPPETRSSALTQTLAQLPAGTQPDIVLVLTESWGLAKDERINQAARQPYFNAAMERLYTIQTGTVRFTGSTTQGETRELCGDSRGHSSFFGPDAYFATCWPARLVKSGYHSLAVHGFYANMFNRQDWYPRFGFQETEFLPQLEQEGAGFCPGPFPGVCDADVAQWIAARLLAPRDQHPIFVHWVTLNSHLPVPLDTSNPGACVAVGIDHEPGLCSWFTRILIVQNSVAQLAQTPGLRPTVFVVVGDHAPPFLTADLRSRFSQTEVPYLVLIPKAVSLKVRPAVAHKPAQKARWKLK